MQALTGWWASMRPFLPPALAVDAPDAAFAAEMQAASSQHLHDSLALAGAMQAAQQALLPPSSPLHLAEWELGLLGLPEEQQGCFHAGCTKAMPTHAAAALEDACEGSCQPGPPSAAPAPTKSLHLCAGCKLVRYCGRECQAAAWRAVHKHTCKLYAAAQKMDAEAEQ
jgi:hypothetical protein